MDKEVAEAKPNAWPLVESEACRKSATSWRWQVKVQGMCMLAAWVGERSDFRRHVGMVTSTSCVNS